MTSYHPKAQVDREAADLRTMFDAVTTALQSKPMTGSEVNLVPRVSKSGKSAMEYSEFAALYRIDAEALHTAIDALKTRFVATKRRFPNK